MEDTCNRMIVYLKRLCDYYSRHGFSSSEISDKSNLPLEILKIAIFLELPEQQIFDSKEAMKNLEQKLLSEYVIICNEKNRLVTVTGYKDNGESMPSSFYIWSVFQYTYILKSDREKMFFLSTTLLAPYLYKYNKWGQVNKRFLDKLLSLCFFSSEERNKIRTWLRKNVSNALGNKNEYLDRWFTKNIQQMGEFPDIEPGKGAKDEALDSFINGVRVAARLQCR